MINSYILAFDPSGSFQEGKGTTGWCLMYHGKLIKCGQLSATNYKTAMEYYEAHLQLISRMQACYKRNFDVVAEDYLLYAKQATAQINSRMETCKLIGILQYYCWTNHIPFTLQTASLVKRRWTDEILEHEGIELPTTHAERHARDAIRHAIHYTYFGG